MLIIYSFEEQDGQTRLTFRRNGIPDYKCEGINIGWKAYYWDKLEQYFKQT